MLDSIETTCLSRLATVCLVFTCFQFFILLQRLSLPSLELRRLYLDLVFCYKVVFGLVSINFDDYFEVRSVLGTRGHAYKLFKPRCTASIHSNFFAEHVISILNSLPVNFVNFSTLKSFHRTIQSVDFSSFLKCS